MPALILSLIVQYGPEAAKGIYEVYKTWVNGKEPSDADWATIIELAQKPLVDPGSEPLIK